MNNITKALIFSVGALFARPLFSQELSVDEAIAKTMENNPDLSAALSERKRADLTVEVEENRLRTNLAAETKYAHNVNSLSGVSNDSMLLSSELTKLFAVGTQLGLGLTLNNTFLADTQSTYGATLSLSVTQPVMRGFGEKLNLSSLRSARYNASSSEASYQSAMSAMLRDVVIAYWELWYAQEALAIQEKSLEVIKSQISEAEIRLSYGTISSSALLSLQTEEASIEEQLANARADIRTRSLSLSTLLGQEASATLTASDALPGPKTLPSLKSLIAKTEAGSYELRSLLAAIDVAQVSLDLATNNKRPTLNAIGQLQLATNSGVDEATNAATGFLGLRLELPSAQNAARAEEEKARLAVQAAQDRFDSAYAKVVQQVSSQVESVTNGAYRLTLAEKTVKLAEASVAAEKARFDAGVGTAIELVRVQQQEREARLRATRIKVEQVNEQIRLAHLTGELLSEQWK